MADSPQYFTLVANTVTTCTFTDNFGRIEVLNVDGAGQAPIYISNDGTTPTIAGTGFHVVTGAMGASLVVEDKSPTTNTVVKLVSAGTPKVSVRGV